MSKKCNLILVFLISILNNQKVFSFEYYASDVLRYAMTSHGITYVLRNDSRSINAWNSKELSKINKLKNYKSKIPSKRWGNTDCSGLTGAALRIKGYFSPETKIKNKNGVQISTRMTDTAAKKKEFGLFHVAYTRKNLSKKLQHADALNRLGKPYGHIFLYNGVHASSGKIISVEARGRNIGVGRFINRTWNDIISSSYKIVRSKKVYNDVPLKNTVPLADARAGNFKYKGKKTYGKGSASTNSNSTIEKDYYIVRSGDSGLGIAREFGLTLNQLKELNPNINLNRIQIGQEIAISS